MGAEQFSKGHTEELLGEAHEVRTLAEVSEFITKGSTPTTYGFEWQTDGIPFLRSECVGENGFTESGLAYIGEDAHHALQRSALRPGDILITITGNVGRIAVLPDQYPAANINQHIARVRISASDIDAKYVQYYLSKPSKRRHFESIVTGLAYPQLSLKQIRETEIVFPPLPEQQRIAEILTAVDDSIRAGERVIEQAERVKKGLMEELLTGGLGSPAIENGEVPEGWQAVKLGDVIARVESGGTPSKSAPAYWGGDINWASVKDMVSFDPNRTIDRITREGLSASSSKLIPHGTVIVCTRMAVGVARIYDCDVAINQDLRALYTNNMCNESYLYYWFEINRSKISDMATGTTVKGIRQTILLSLLVVLPPLREQRRIAAILSSVDDQIDAERRHVEQQKRLKRGLMDDLLTGRVRTV